MVVVEVEVNVFWNRLDFISVDIDVVVVCVLVEVWVDDVFVVVIEEVMV